MHASEVPRALTAATATAASLGLAVDDAVVLSDSNRLAVHLLPCDVLARVAHSGDRAAAFEVELAQRLAETDAPVAVLEPRVAPVVHERDGFSITLWSYYESRSDGEVSAADRASALQRLHAGMRNVDVTAPHFTDRVAEAQRLVASPAQTPALPDDDRNLLADALRHRERAIGRRGAPEQLLHGEPHPGNLLDTTVGPRFIDLETCCRGPVELDLAHVPEEICRHYEGADRDLLLECRGLVLAMVAAWRWDREDRFPNGRRAGRDLLDALRDGPPWPTLDMLMPPA
jgi:hypothetical protein